MLCTSSSPPESSPLSSFDFNNIPLGGERHQGTNNSNDSCTAIQQQLHTVSFSDLFSSDCISTSPRSPSSPRNPFPTEHEFSMGSARQSSVVSTPCDSIADLDLRVASSCQLPFKKYTLTGTTDPLASMIIDNYESSHFASALNNAICIDPSVLTVGTASKALSAAGNADKELTALEALRESLQGSLPINSYTQRGCSSSVTTTSADVPIPTPVPTSSTTVFLDSMQKPIPHPPRAQLNKSHRKVSSVTGWNSGSKEEYPAADGPIKNPFKEVTDRVRAVGGIAISECPGVIIPPSRLINKQSRNSAKSSKKRKEEVKTKHISESDSSTGCLEKPVKSESFIPLCQPFNTSPQNMFSLMAVPTPIGNGSDGRQSFPGLQKLVPTPATTYRKGATVVRSQSRPNLHTLLPPHAARALTQRYFQAQDDERAKLKAIMQANATSLPDVISGKAECATTVTLEVPVDAYGSSQSDDTSIGSVSQPQTSKKSSFQAGINNTEILFDEKTTLPSLVSVLGDYFTPKRPHWQTLDEQRSLCQSNSERNMTLSRASSTTACNSVVSPSELRVPGANSPLNAISPGSSTSAVSSDAGPLTPNPDLLFGDPKKYLGPREDLHIKQSLTHVSDRFVLYPLETDVGLPRNSAHLLCDDPPSRSRLLKRRAEEAEAKLGESEEAKRPRLETSC